MHLIYWTLLSEMKEIGQAYMYMYSISGIKYESECLDFSLHAVLNWWAWQFKHTSYLRIHVLAPGFFQLNCKCIGMILITSTHYIAIRIYISSFQQFLKKSIYVNSFIMGYGKRSLQDFYTLPLGCVCTRMTQRPASLCLLSSDWLRQVSYFKT